MKKKVRKKPEQETEKEEVVVLVEKEKEKGQLPDVKMTPVEEEQEPMTPLAAASPMKTEMKK